MGDVVESFLEPLKRQFTVPKQAEGNEKGFWSDYIRSLETFSDEVLEKAARNLMEIRLTRTFPTVGECNAACKQTIEAEAINQMEVGREHVRKEHEPLEVKYPECSPHLINAAYRMMKEYPQIEQAANEYWIWGLFDWCCKNQSTPDKYQVESIKRKSKQTLNDLLKAVGDGTRIENATRMRGTLLGTWVTAQNKHRGGVGLPPIGSDDLHALVERYQQGEAA